jgi:uncharacterized membrane protein
MESNTVFYFIILYIGPGLGGGTIAAIIGILTAFIFSLIAIIWYPVKKFARFIKKLFKNKE